MKFQVCHSLLAKLGSCQLNSGRFLHISHKEVDLPINYLLTMTMVQQTKIYRRT
jgi:hypothetical protein